MAAASDPGLSRMWGNERYSDVIVVIGRDSAAEDSSSEEAPTKKRKCAASTTVAAGATDAEFHKLRLHACVLAGHSPVLDNALQCCDERPITLPVHVKDADEADAVVLMLRAMYEGPPDLTAAKAMAMIQVAHKYEARSVERAGCDWLTGNAMDVATAAAFFALPSEVMQERQDLVDKAMASLEAGLYLPGTEAALVAYFDDLEIAMNDTTKRERLRALSAAAITKLLNSSDIKVAHESTVAAVAMEWASAKGLVQVPDDVAYCVRVARLAPEFVVATRKWFPQWNGQDVTLAYAYKNDARAWRESGESGANLLSRTLREPRALSSVKEAKLSWRLPLEAIEAAHDKALSAGAVTTRVACAPSTLFGGYTWILLMEWHNKALGLRVGPDLLAFGKHIRQASVRVRHSGSIAVPRGADGSKPYRRRYNSGLSGLGGRWGWSHFFPTPVTLQDSWDATAAPLAEFVHSDGCLSIEATVTLR